MNILDNKRKLKLAALLTLGVSSLIYAVAVFIPTTQPTVLIGQYAMASRDLTQGNTIAYRPWFENGAWQGDIIQYDILADGTRRTDVPVGANPATAGTAGYCGPTAGAGCWSARATFIANGADNPTGAYWQNRNIITNNNGQVAFTWDQISPAQRSALDQDTVNAIIAAGNPILNTNPDISDVLNYVRGQRLHEKNNNTLPGSLGDLRTRYSVLGDITGTPVYIGPPRGLLSRVTGYTTFASSNASRPGRLAVPANDGMLHILDASNGSEVYSYIPSMVMDKLSRLAARHAAYTHTYFVDGEMTTGSVQIGSGTPVWHTILTGGGGAGFAGLYALDVTDADFPGTSPHNTKLLFEKTGGNWGHIYGRPRIGFIGNSNADPTWYIFTGNGYSTSAGQPTALMMINMDTFSVTEINATGTGGLSAPVLLSTDDDDMVELAFAGDINGDLWMFEINQTTPSSTLVTKVYDGSVDQPITNAPAIGKHPTESGYIIYFGTGSLLSTTDALNDGENPAGSGNFIDKQAVHGIWLDTSNMTTLKSGLPYYSSDLQTQTFTEASKVFIAGSSAEKVRIVTSPNPVYYRCPFGVSPCPTLHKGWKVNLPNCGERLIGSPFLRAGRLQFATNNPTGLNCGTRSTEGDSWVMSLDYVSGADADTIVYNLNGDNSLNSADAIQVTSGGTTVDEPPVGLHLGKGNISQPAFARLKFGADKMFINGILLPVPPVPGTGPLLGGHIDVHVDSYDGGDISPNSIDKHSEGYGYNNVTGSSVTQVNDGLGRAADGHVHNYDEIHGVNYVDLFELEPRRGKANLVATLGGTPAGATGTVTCSTGRNSKEILVTGSPNDSCIQAIEGEMSRAYDILHTDTDGNTEPLNGTDPVTGGPAPVWQSEVHILNATNPPDFTTAVPGKKFIVVLANADRSIAGTLQIGCRTWPVVDYQNMITSQLQAGVLPSALVDTINGGGLEFTLAGIMAENPANCPQGETAISLGLSDTPTIRVGFTQRAILDSGVHATRAQCVLGLHDYNDPVCFSDATVLTAAEGQLANLLFDPAYSQPSSCGSVGATIPLSYVRDPVQNRHITKAPSSEGNGYRWRNGALTVQLLDAGIDPLIDLQDPQWMLSGAGTHAQAYTVVTGTLNATELEEANNLNNGRNESGLLYEASMYWHYSDLVDKIRNADPTSNSTPKDAACYGGNAYNGQTTINIGGLTLGEYQNLTSPLLADCAVVAAANAANGTNIICDLDRFGQLLNIIDNAQSDTQLNQALLELANLLANNAALAAYAELRKYVGDRIPGQHLIDIDKGQLNGGNSGNSSTSDGTPATIISLEDLDTETLGPNFAFGRRNWVDIRQ